MGKFLLISDIHANEEALRAVLNDAGAVDGIVCAGDIVGYGPKPNEVCDILRDLDVIAVGGNHDLSAVGLFDPRHMHGAALSCIEQHIEELSPINKQWLQATPEYRFLGQKREGVDSIVLVHGRPRPKYFLDYIYSKEDAIEAADDIEAGRPLRAHHVIFGHTHIPAVWQVTPRAWIDPKGDSSEGIHDLLNHGDEHVFPFDESEGHFLINPGSVGQPRDGNPFASYMTLESDYDTYEYILKYKRVQYDYVKVIEQMLEAKYPPSMALRLAGGV